MTTSLLPPGQRRVTLKPGVQPKPGHDSLKAIAGLIQKLSFRDMKQFAEILEAQNLTGTDTAEALLAAADQILGDTNGH